MNLRCIFGHDKKLVHCEKWETLYYTDCTTQCDRCGKIFAKRLNGWVSADVIKKMIGDTDE